MFGLENFVSSKITLFIDDFGLSIDMLLNLFTRELNIKLYFDCFFSELKFFLNSYNNFGLRLYTLFILLGESSIFIFIVQL